MALIRSLAEIPLFAGLSEVRDELSLQWVIHFPWVTDAHRFHGETVYGIRPLTAGESVSIPFSHA